VIEFMQFRLETLQAIEQHEELFYSLHPLVVAAVKAGNIVRALAVFDSINVLLLRGYDRQYFLQEQGVLQRLAGNLDGALEDLTVSLEIGGDDYDCLKHRAYVKFLLGDFEGARLDAARCAQMGVPDYYPTTRILAGAPVAFMDYDLE
jgi:hypothetical protein